MARSGLVTLAQAAQIYFDQNGVPVQVAVGFGARWKLWNQGPDGANRLVFIPGDYNGDPAEKPLDEGRLYNPLKLASDNPRELVEWQRTVTISVWGVDPDQPNDEVASILATDRLLEWTVRAVNNAVDPETGLSLGADRDEDGRLTWGKVTRTYPPLETAFGVEYLVRFEMRGPLYDVPSTTLVPTLGTLTKNFAPPAPPSTPPPTEE